MVHPASSLTCPSLAGGAGFPGRASSTNSPDAPSTPPVTLRRRRKSANDGSKPPFRRAYPPVTIPTAVKPARPPAPAGPRHWARPPARISPEVPQGYLPTPRAGGHRRAQRYPWGRQRGGGGVSPGGSRPGHTSSAPKGGDVGGRIISSSGERPGAWPRSRRATPAGFQGRTPDSHLMEMRDGQFGVGRRAFRRGWRVR